MSSNIAINGTTYSGRTGADAYGTWTRVVQPARLGGTTAVNFEIGWGTAIAEMSGRSRGLSGVGTLTYAPGPGTHVPATVVFPSSFFSVTPITDLKILTGLFTPTAALPYVAVSSELQTYEVGVGLNLDYTPLLLPIGIYLTEISTVRMVVARQGYSNLTRVHGWASPISFYWHAFGL